MFHRGENKLGTVERLTRENEKLTTENARLERLQVTGNAASLASTIIETVDGWVGADGFTDPAGYGEALDPAIASGMQAAARSYTQRVFGRVAPQEALNLAGQILPAEQLIEVAAQGLLQAIRHRPADFLAYASADLRKSILEKAFGDTELAENVIEEITNKKRNSVKRIQAHFTDTGFVNLELLEPGDRVDASVKTFYNGKYKDVTLKAVAVTLKKRTVLEGVSANPWPFDDRFRIGQRDNRKRFTMCFIPGCEVLVQARDENDFYDSNCTIVKITGLAINKSVVSLEL